MDICFITLGLTFGLPASVALFENQMKISTSKLESEFVKHE